MYNATAIYVYYDAVPTICLISEDVTESTNFEMVLKTVYIYFPQKWTKKFFKLQKRNER